MKINHDCDNYICRLLNPSLERLLEYEELKDRLTQAEEYFFNKSSVDRFNRKFPIDMFGWCGEHCVWQFLNKEFIQELAKKLKEIDPEIILEVGAGEGLIGSYLCKELDKELNKDFIITDDYSWWSKNENLKKVIKMDYKNAIKTYKPDLVIASWIPYDRYWTEDFRSNDSVEGYILIGEHPGGCTGSEMDWKTSWKICELNEVEKFGICRTDHGFYGFGRDEPCTILHTNVTYFKKP